MEAVLEPLTGAMNDKVAKVRKLAVLALSKVSDAAKSYSEPCTLPITVLHNLCCI